MQAAVCMFDGLVGWWLLIKYQNDWDANFCQLLLLIDIPSKLRRGHHINIKYQSAQAIVGG